jgi:predicted MFS family arabinose efflux permease
VTSRGPSIYTREFILLNIVLGCASAVMALFFQFHQYLLSLGIDPRWHGFLLGADSVTGIVLQPLLSPYLHTGNAKKAAAAGICTMAVSLVLYNFAMTPATITCVRVLHGTGFIVLIASIMALFASHIPPERSGEAIGLISIARLIPYALIPPVVVYLAGRSYGFVSIVTVVAGLVLLFLVPLAFVGSTPEGQRGPEKGTGLKGLAEDLKSGPVRMLLAVNVVFYSAYTSLFFFFKDFGTVRGMENPGFFFTVAMAAMIVVRLAGSRYFDKMKKAPASAVCMGLLAVCHVVLGLSRGPGAFLFLAPVFGVLWGVGIPLLMALLFDISESRFRGLNMNLSLVMMQAGFFVGPLVGGFILARWGYGPLFIFCGALNALGAVMLILPRGFRPVFR